MHAIEKRKVFTLGYLGGISIERGAIEVLHALEYLNQIGYDVNMIFAGPYSNDVISNAITMKMIDQKKCFFWGRVLPNEGWKIMAECHVGIATLHPSPNFIDSYPTKIFEYTLLKLPVITSNFPLYRFVIEESNSGILVNPLNYLEISEAIIYLINNPEIASKMGENGRNAAFKSYSWDSEYNKLVDF